jgi:hypothetical protein
MKREATVRIREAERIAEVRGSEKARKAQSQVLKTVQAKEAKIDRLNAQVRDLQEKVRKGVTQQRDGLDFEKLLLAELRRRFKQDKIEPFGKAGDILHTILDHGQDCGSILYECKKTDKWSNGFLKQARRDMGKRQADFGVVVTFALPRSSRDFMVRPGVMFVHPYGAVYLADTLRTGLIEGHAAKSSPKRMRKQFAAIVAYIQGPRFKAAMGEIIGEVRELVAAMKKEKAEHKRHWIERYARYGTIYSAAARVKQDTTTRFKGGAAEIKVENHLPPYALLEDHSVSD